MKPILTLPGYYAYPDSTITGPYKKPIHQSKDKDGYAVVRVRFEGKNVTKKVHRLVCEAFHGPSTDSQKKSVLHRDGNKQNNTPPNLRWGSPSENSQDALLHFTEAGSSWAHWNQGEKHRSSKLTPQKVKMIRQIPDNAPRGTKTAIARALGVSPALITNIRKGSAWKHIAFVKDSPDDDFNDPLPERTCTDGEVCESCQ